MPIVAPAPMAVPLLLATEGFGIDLDILNGNLVNLAILIPVLFWFLKGFLGGILSRRGEAILQDLHEAESRLSEATAQLEKAEAELAAARETAQTILKDGQARADAIRAEGEQRTIAEMARLQEEAKADTDSEARRMSNELLSSTAEQAIALALKDLPDALSDQKQTKLLEATIHSLG
ncbi:MAG: F0F1 ATP synthase subunit B [Cyanobacteria bacterium MAG IRC3_bin_20]|nr:F0F1 ATP synthase subunit B [Cyanobacteria bacterium MAG IRC3_bin_20]